MSEEAEAPIKINFVVPKVTDPGGPKRKMASLAVGRVSAKVASFVTEEQRRTPEYFEAVEEALMAKYRWLATYVIGCTPEQALDQIMQCSDEQIDAMDAALGFSDPKDTLESQSKSAGT